MAFKTCPVLRHRQKFVGVSCITSTLRFGFHGCISFLPVIIIIIIIIIIGGECKFFSTDFIADIFPTRQRNLGQGDMVGSCGLDASGSG
jgi:hypothetical protein